MKQKKLGALLLAMALLASLLAGCGSGSSQSTVEEDGRGDLILEEPGASSMEELQEPEVNFEDFFGCWEYEEYDIWVYIYGDGTYEILSADGNYVTGNYTPEGVAVVLDNGRSFLLADEGGLIDDEGDALFASETPTFG